MAVTKTYINGDWTALQGVLQSSGLFASVVIDSDRIHCKDEDENIVVTIGSGTATIYADATNSISASSLGTITNAYVTSKGILINNSNNKSVIIAKTNNGKIGGAIRTDSELWTYSVCAWDDDLPITQTFNFMEESDTITPQQTIFCPVPTHNKYGETSILDGVYATPWNEYRYMGVFTDKTSGKEYVSNGYMALMDE